MERWQYSWEIEICPCLLNDLFRLSWSMCLTGISIGSMANAGVHSTSSWRLIFGGLVISFELTGMSLSNTKGGLMKFMQRLGVSLVSEAGMFWWTPSVTKSGGNPVFGSSSDSSLQPLIGGVGVLVWSVSRSGRRFPIRFPVSLTCLQLTGGGSCWIWIPMVALTN